MLRFNNESLVRRPRVRVRTPTILTRILQSDDFERFKIAIGEYEYEAPVYYTWFPAIRNNGGAVQSCKYMSTTIGESNVAAWAAVGFTSETFLVNVNGVMVSRQLMCSATPLGPVPLGNIEVNPFLTKDGTTNVTRTLVYVDENLLSTSYTRPNLFPFSFSSIPDLSGSSGYVTFGTTANALESLTNLFALQISVSWSFSWKYNVLPTVYNNIYSVVTNLPSFIPAQAGSENISDVSWYNTNTSGTKRANPAARVLYAGSGSSLIESTVTVDSPIGDIYNLQTILRPSRTGTATRLAFNMLAVNLNSPGAMLDPFYASFDNIPADNLSSVSVNLMGTSVPFYLKTGGPTAADITIVGPITFSATVTPTFSAV